MAGYSICPENTPHPNPLPQREREVMFDLPFASPPVMGGEKGEGDLKNLLTPLRPPPSRGKKIWRKRVQRRMKKLS